MMDIADKENLDNLRRFLADYPDPEVVTLKDSGHGRAVCFAPDDHFYRAQVYCSDRTREFVINVINSSRDALIYEPMKY